MRVVLANEGNVDEQGVTLVVTAVPQGTTRRPAPVRVRTDLAAGRSVALSPPTLSVRPGTSYVVDVTATAPEPGARATTSASIRVAALPPTPTTTTTTPTSTTVRPG